MIDLITKAYVLRNFAVDAIDFVRDRLSDMEWDRDSLLHRAGLTSYRPAKAALGASALFFAGAVVGGALGLILAPRAGKELRGQMKERARKMMGNGPDASVGAARPGATASYDRPRS
jgi:hypothetical protein